MKTLAALAVLVSQLVVPLTQPLNLDSRTGC